MPIKDIFLDIAELIIYMISAYYLVTAAISLIYKPAKNKTDTLYKFSVVIPAYNEESVICDLLTSLKNADYPKELIDVYVVADGCVDKTADIARKSGAYVIEKEKASSKGDALQAAFEYIKDNGYNCDYIAVLDADNIVDSCFFREASKVASSGAKVIQGYVDSKNPYNSWVANAHSVWYWITNRIFQAGRSYMSIGARINGTGFAISRDTLETVPWQVKTMAEDLEYTCMLAEKKIKVSFAEKAITYDEKPTSFKDSVSQRTRWSTGISDVKGMFSFKFLKRFKLNDFMGLWEDFFAPVSYIVLLLSAIIGKVKLWNTVPGYIALCTLLILFPIAAILGLIKDNKFRFKSFMNIFGCIICFISWIPVGIVGIFGKRKDEWIHLKHRLK